MGISKSLLSIIWVLLWSASFSTMMAIAKFVSSGTSTIVIVFIRIIFGFMFFSPFLMKTPLINIKTKKFPLHVLRVLFVCGSMMCTYYAYTHLPLAFATSIGFTAPLITTVLAIFVLKEKVGLTRWIALGIGYIGVLIIVHPSNFPFEFAVVVALFANLFASSSNITLKKLSSTESTIQIMFYLNVLSFFLIGIISVFFWQLPSLQDLLFLMALGLLATFAQFCLVQALKNGNPSTIAPFEYSRLIFSIPLGFILFNEVPTFQTIIGALLIAAINIYLTLQEARGEPKDNAARSI